MILLAVSAAYALGPTTVGLREPLGSQVSQIAVSDDQEWIVTVDGGSGVLLVADPSSFDVYEVWTCSGAAGVAVVPTSGGYGFWTGCADGTVAVWEVDSSGDLTFDSVAVSDGPIVSVDTDGDSVFALADESGLVVYAVDPSTHALATSGSWGGAFGTDSFVDSVAIDNRLVVVHSGARLSWVDTSTGSIASETESLAADWNDGYRYNGAAVLLADEDGDLVRWDASTGYSILQSGVGDAVRGVVVDEDGGFALVSTDVEAVIYEWSGGLGSPVATLADGGDLYDMVVTDGYVWAITGGEELAVLTDRPWVEAGDPTPDSGTAGTTITVPFHADTAGEWRVRVGGTTAEDGTLLASGTAEAGEDVTASFDIDATFAEGINRVWVFVEAGGLVGHDAVFVTVDNPPSTVHLVEGQVGIGDGSVSVYIDGITDEDLAGYTVYLSATAFTADDFPTGGPAFDGPAEDDDVDAVNAPRSVSAAPGEDVEVGFGHLVNGTTYYVAVRATDDNANEGPMSAVIAATPEETFSASELRGDPGGYCATTTPAAGLGLALAGLVTTLTRRRRGGRSLAAVAVVGLSALAVSTPAHAAEGGKGPHFHARITAGPVTLADPYVTEVFGEWNVLARGEYGYTNRFFEFGLGAGYFHKSGYLLTSSGETSNEDDRLTIIPLSATATLRLDFFNEQIVVPVGRIGGDYWMWKEKWWTADGSDAVDKRTGGKLGWHWGAGAWILLDPLDRRAASELEAKTGIQDSFLTLEYRQTSMQHSDVLLDFSDREFLVGVKCDF